MTTLVKICHSCRANVAFNIVHQHRPTTEDKHRTILFACCPSCGAGLVIDGQLMVNANIPTAHGSLETYDHFVTGAIYPSYDAKKAPQGLPDFVELYFNQSVDTFDSSNFDASAMMSRKTLEVACKHLNPEGKGNLYNRIEQLSNLGMLTDDIKSWAHIIRDDGNDAAHEIEPTTKAFAEELIHLTEALLTYTYTLPDMISARRKDQE